MNIYQEHILDHYHDPVGKHQIADPTHESTGINTSCGDEITIQLKVTGDEISDIAFSGVGCAISQAAASMLCEKLLGETVDALRAMQKDDMLTILKVPLSMSRIKCGLLALETAQKALQKNP